MLLDIKQIRIKLLSGFLFLILSLFVFSVAHAATGVEWLATQTQADGSYSYPVDVATPFQSTTETLRTFNVLGKTTQTTQPGILNALQFINAEGFHTTEILSRKIIANHQAGNDVSLFMTELLAMQNTDGGYGDLLGYDSTALDTAFAIDVFSTVGGIPNEVTINAVNFLISQQNPDGSFRVSYQNQSSVYATALVLSALQPYVFSLNIAANIESAKDFLFQSQDVAGVWASDWETALALIALVPVTTDSSLYASAVSVLQSSQQANGSWADDVYATALVIRALFLVENVELPVDPTTGIFNGKVVDILTGSPLAGVGVSLIELPAIQIFTGQDGLFTLLDVPPGSYTARYQLAGYDDVTQAVSVQAGFVFNLGTIKLTPSPAVGIILGTITQADNGLPVPGAVVQVSGSSPQSVMTDSNGFYRVTHVPEQVTLSVSASGFDPVSVTASVLAGSTLNYSPALYALNTTPTQAVTVKGRILDDTASTALADVLVEVSGTATNTLSNGAGDFSLTNLSSGEFSIDVSKAGYQTLRLNLAASENSVIDLGVIRLSPSISPTTTTVIGQVLDAVSGNQIAGADVTIDVTGTGVMTSPDGSYRIEGIAGTQFKLTANAVGYITSTINVSLSANGVAVVDFSLQQAGLAGFNITDFTTDKTSYASFSSVNLSISLGNTSVDDRIVKLLVKIVNSNNEIVEKFTPRFAPQAQDPDEHSLFVAATSQRLVSTFWNTGQRIAGSYTLFVQAYDVSTNQLAAERSAAIDIEVTNKLGGQVIFDPPITQLASKAPVSISAKVLNRGNELITATEVTAQVSLVNKGYSQANNPFEIQNFAIDGGLNQPDGMDFDSAGNLYIANINGNTVSKITPDGTISEFANGLILPTDVDIDSAGNIYVINSRTSIIRFGADGSRSEILTGLSSHKAIEALSDGRILFTNGGELYEITTDGTVNKILTQGLSNPQGVAIDSQGGVYIANRNSNSISLFKNGTLSTFATGINQPTGIAIDGADNVYVTSFGDGALIKITVDGTVSTVTTGLSGPYDVKISPAGEFIVSNNNSNTIVIINSNGDISPVYESFLYVPTAADYDAAGNLYVSNSGSRNLIKILPDGSTSILAGTGSNPVDLLVANDGAIYLADSYNKISRYQTDGTRSDLVTGLNSPQSMVEAADGNGLLVTETVQDHILRVDFSGNVTTYVDGKIGNVRSMRTDSGGNVFILSDAGYISKVSNTGQLSQLTSGLGQPYSMALENTGNVLVTEYTNQKILRVDSLGATQVVASLAFRPGAITVDQAGNIYVAAWGGNTIYAVDNAGVATVHKQLIQPIYHDMVVDVDGTFWTSNQHNSNVTKLSASGTEEVFSLVSGPRSLILDGVGGVFVGGFGWVRHIDSAGVIVDVVSGGPILNKTLYGMTIDSANQLWVSEYNGLITKYNPDHSSYKQFSALSRPSGMEYIGTDLYVVNGGHRNIVRLSAPDSLPEVIAEGSYQQVLAESSTTLLLSTTNSISRLNLIDGSVSNYASGFSTITSLTKSSLGEISVVDLNNNQLFFYDVAGTLLRQRKDFFGPRGILFDSNGQLLVASSFPAKIFSVNNGQLNIFAENVGVVDYMALNDDGRVSVTAGGFIRNLSVTGNQISAHVLQNSGEIKGIAQDANGDLLFAASTQSVLHRLLPNGTFQTVATGLSNPQDLETNSSGEIFVADNSTGVIHRVNPDGSSSIIENNLGSVTSIVFAPDDTMYATTNGQQIVSITTDGTRTDFPVRTILAGRRFEGLALDNNQSVYASMGLTSNSIVKIVPNQTPPEIIAGDVVYSATVTLPGLDLDASSIPLDFGSWAPPESGDYIVSLSVSNGQTNSNISNSIHVGPKASSVLSVETSSVLPGDRTVSANLNVVGADSSNVTKIDIDAPSTSTTGVPAPRGWGLLEDSLGNTYFGTYNKVIKITPDGQVSDYATGLRLSFRMAIDSKDNIYIADFRNILKGTPTTTPVIYRTLEYLVTAIEVGFDDNLYVTTSFGGLLRVNEDGTYDSIAAIGADGAFSLTSDAYGNFYIDSDITHQVTRITPEGNASIYLDNVNFEHEGITTTADCSNNLLFAPRSTPRFTTSFEEDKIFQLVGDTGEVRLVLDGPTLDPLLADMDLIYYDKRTNRLLVWTDFSNGKIWSFPVICGGIDVNAHIITSTDVDLSSANPAPASVIDLGNGTQEYIWSLADVDIKGFNIQLNLLANGLIEGETRAIAQEAFLEFNNSFMASDSVRVPIDIPVITATTDVRVTPQLDATQYGPNSPVAISVNVLNANDAPFTGSLVVSIQDAAGNTVIDLAPVQINALAPSIAQTYTSAWDTGTVFSGDYQLVIALLDESGSDIKQETVGFSILSSDPATPGDVIQTTVYTDKQTYQAWDSIQITGRLQNVSQNAIQSGANVDVTLRAPDGTILYFNTTSVGEMIPGTLIDLPFQYSIVDVVSGQYTVEFVAKDLSGQVLNSSSSSFQVNRQDIQSLTGSATITARQVFAGDAQTCNTTLTNNSSFDIAGASVSHLIMNVDTATVISTRSQAQNLAAGAVLTNAIPVATNGLAAGGYSCILQASVSGTTQTIAFGGFVVLDNPNQVPVANAGLDVTVKVAQTVILNGSGSTDADNDPISYQWTLIDKPVDSNAVLVGAANVAPSIIPDRKGLYTIQLIVNDGTIDSLPDTVVINAVNTKPLANAGIDQDVYIGDTITLNGSASSDADGDTLSYQWAIMLAPAGSASNLSNSTTANPGINIDSHGSYTIQLIVNDGVEDSVADTVVLTVLNRAPVANAGVDQIVHINDIVALNGLPSSDVDGDILMFTWRIVTAPIGSASALSNAHVAQPTIDIDGHGEYQFELIVNDGFIDSAADTVLLTVENRIPVADAGPDQSMYINDTVTLDASNSQDADNDVLTYSWSIISAPVGSTSVLSDSTVPQPTLVIDGHGSYTLQVIVNDGFDNSLPDTVVVNVLNRLPVANAGPDQGADGSIEAIYSTVVLDGSASTDGDGDPISFLWTIADKPAGSTTALVNPGSVSPFFVPDLVGQYVVKLIVKDGFDNSAPDTVSINVVEPKPIISGEMKLQGKGRLLVLMDGENAKDTHDSEHGSEHGNEHGNEHEEGDGQAYKGEPSFIEQSVILEGILIRAGWSFNIVTNVDIFTYEMRTGEYSAYAILSEKQKLEELVQRELREAVYRGEGLLVAGGHDNRMEKLEAALGIKHEGKHSKATGLDVLVSEIHDLGEQADFTLEEKALRIELEGAHVVANYQVASKPEDKKHGKDKDDDAHDENNDEDHKDNNVAITVFDYGLGTSVFSGLDLLAQATAAGQGSLFETLLANALGVAHPDSLKSLAGGVVPVTIELSNERVSTLGRVVITLPDGMHVVDANVPLTTTGNGAIWEFDILDGASLSMTFWVKLLDQPGLVTIEALAQSGEAFDLLDQATLNFDIDVEASPTITGVIDETRLLKNQFPDEKVFKKVLKELEHADKELVKGKPEKALKELIKATDKLLETSHLEGEQLRFRIDLLIRDIEQSI